MLEPTRLANWRRALPRGRAGGSQGHDAHRSVKGGVETGGEGRGQFFPCSFAVPTNMANANPREMDREATSIAMLNEKTIPMLAKVLSIPEATPNTWGLTALISAVVLAGRNCWRRCRSTRWLLPRAKGRCRPRAVSRPGAPPLAGKARP